MSNLYLLSDTVVHHCCIYLSQNQRKMYLHPPSFEILKCLSHAFLGTKINVNTSQTCINSDQIWGIAACSKWRNLEFILHVNLLSEANIKFRNTFFSETVSKLLLRVRVTQWTFKFNEFMIYQGLCWNK